MLEQQGLLLGPWAPPAGTRGAGRHGAAAARAVLDASTRSRLGVVRQRGGGGRLWLRWLGRQSLEVCEAEDESLLCTVLSPWWLARVGEVYDADERRVAVVHGPRVLDGYGQLLADFRTSAQGGRGRFVAPEGVELGQVITAGAETILQFSAAVAEQPFAKMALLGAVLCRG